MQYKRSLTEEEIQFLDINELKGNCVVGSMINFIKEGNELIYTYAIERDLTSIKFLIEKYIKKQLLEYTIDKVREKKIAQVKVIASRKMTSICPDYKLDRHKEQKELGISTSILNTEYISLIQMKQKLREISNEIEKEILAYTDLHLLFILDIENHKLWDTYGN